MMNTNYPEKSSGSSSKEREGWRWREGAESPLSGKQGVNDRGRSRADQEVLGVHLVFAKAAAE